MADEWIMDVLSDLRTFAAKQSFLELAEHLDDAIFIAAAEIRRDEEELKAQDADNRQNKELSGNPAFSDFDRRAAIGDYQISFDI
ncbi:MAG TPA: hypothetical protein VLA51_01495 [Paracoccaceae bacterium]|nr:hypothetical protein [Paracoccaceae bacterium]